MVIGGGASSKASAAPLRVLWIADSEKRALSSQFANFARAVQGSRVQVELVVLEPLRAAERSDATRAGHRLQSVNALGAGDIGAFLRLRRRARGGSYDLIHTHGSWSALWGTIVGRFTDIPVVATLYGSMIRSGATERVSGRERRVRWVLRRWAARVVALSGAQWDHYVRNGIFPRVFIDLIHPGVEVPKAVATGRDREPSREWLRSKTGFPAWARIAATVADVDEWESGVDVLLWAVPRVVQANPHARFVVVGEGRHRSELERRVRARGLNKFVVWLGTDTQVGAVLSGSDLFIHPSLRDPFPVTALKAMALGLPVVGTRVGGVPEIIGTAETGRLVPRSNADALAEAVVELLEDPQRLEAMRCAAHERAASVFSLSHWIDQTTHTYEAVIEEAQRDRAPRARSYARLSVQLTIGKSKTRPGTSEVSERIPVTAP